MRSFTRGSLMGNSFQDPSLGKEKLRTQNVHGGIPQEGTLARSGYPGPSFSFPAKRLGLAWVPRWDHSTYVGPLEREPYGRLNPSRPPQMPVGVRGELGGGLTHT